VSNMVADCRQLSNRNYQPSGDAANVTPVYDASLPDTNVSFRQFERFIVHKGLLLVSGPKLVDDAIMYAKLLVLERANIDKASGQQGDAPVRRANALRARTSSYIERLLHQTGLSEDMSTGFGAETSSGQPALLVAECSAANADAWAAREAQLESLINAVHETAGAVEMRCTLANSSGSAVIEFDTPGHRFGFRMVLRGSSEVRMGKYCCLADGVVLLLVHSISRKIGVVEHFVATHRLVRDDKGSGWLDVATNEHFSNAMPNVPM
jgi:hypothetical protein